MKKRCRVCTEAETFLDAPSTAKPEEEYLRITNVGLALQNHRAEIEGLLRRPELRDLERRRAT